MELLLSFLNQSYEKARILFPYMPYLLIISTIFFIFLYTYHSLYRINRNLFLDKDAEYALDKDRTIPPIVFYTVSIVILVGLFYIYGKIKDMERGDLWMRPIELFYGALCPTIFILAIVGFFMYQKRIITFADSNDMKRSIIASLVFIYISLFSIFIWNRNHEAVMYISGFFLTFFIIHLLYLVSCGNTLMREMSQHKFETLSKICLLGKGNSVESEPYLFQKKSTKECDCKNNESFQCLRDNGKIEIEDFVNMEEEDVEDLKYEYDIPVSYYNNKTQKYEDLMIRDFYYIGSYYSYLADSPLNGTPDIHALKGVIRDFKARIIHLDIYNKDGKPVVQCEKMAPEAQGIPLEDAFAVISKYAWSEYGAESLPLFLYLRFEESGKSKKIYQTTYSYIEEYFGNYLADKLYGFNERNHLFPIAELPIKDALGKMILLTNVYPTYTILDEIIHCNVEDPLSSIKMKEFKKDYLTYDKQGLLIDHTKEELIKEGQKSMTFYYTNPDENSNALNQSKGGLYNPNFEEVAKYGGQSALFYLYLPDSNNQKTLELFKRVPKELILKEPSLRNIKRPQVREVKSATDDLTAPMESQSAIQALISYNPTFT